MLATDFTAASLLDVAEAGRDDADPRDAACDVAVFAEGLAKCTTPKVEARVSEDAAV